MNRSPNKTELGFLFAAFTSAILIMILVLQLGRIEVTRYRWLPFFDCNDLKGNRKNSKKSS